MISPDGVVVIPKEKDLSYLSKAKRTVSYPVAAPLEENLESIQVEKHAIMS